MIQWWPSVLTNKPILLLLGSLVLAGCSLNTPMPQADLALPQTWNTASAENLWPTSNWWQHYQSQTLDSLLDQARRDNLDLATASSRLLQADAQLAQAGAGLLPQVQASLGADRAGSDGSSPGNRFSAGLSTAYEVDFWGRNRAVRDAARASYQATAFDRETLAISLDTAVIGNWLQLLENAGRVTLARDSLASAERVQQLVEARYRYGAADRLELSQQNTLVAQLRAGLPALEQQQRQLRTSLALLLGQGPDFELPELEQLSAISIPQPGAGIPSELLTRRPDILASEARLIAANADLTAARAALLPSIQLTGQLGSQSSDLSSLLSNPSTAWNLAAGLTQPIFQGGRLRAQVSLSSARQEELLIDYRRTVLTALGEVDNALDAVNRAGQRYRFLEQVEQQAELAFNLAETRYRAGAITLQTLLDTQRTWYQSQDSLVQQRSTWLLSTLDLYRALGGGWQIDGVV